MAARIGRIVALLAALSGLFSYFRRQAEKVPFDPLAKAVGSALLVALLVLFLTGAAVVEQEPEPLGLRDEWWTALRGVERLGVPLLPLALLPLAPSSATFAAAAFAVALAAYGASVGRDAFLPPPAARARGNPFRPWEVSVLGFCALIAVLYARIGWRAVGNFQNDSAYYFGVAKHMARSGRIEEPIVWHFLRKPQRVPAAPFDYWGGLTSVTLVPFLAVFGRTQHVANTVMAGFSAAGVALFAYSVAVYRVVRTRMLAGAVVVGFALLPGLAGFRFDTESIPLYDFVLLLTLLLAFQQRWAWSSLCAALLYQVRPDGAVITLFIWLWALRESHRAGRARRVLLVQAAALAVTVMAGARAIEVRVEATHLKDQLDLYLWAAHPHVDLVAGRLNPHAIATRAGEVLQTLLDVVPGGVALIGLTVVAGAFPLARRERETRSRHVMLWCLGFPCAFFVGIACGPMFAGMRTLHGLVPLVMLGCALAVESLVARIWLWRAAPQWQKRGATVVIIGLTVGAILRPLSLYGDRAKARLGSAEHDLQSLGSRIQSAAVASNLPYYVIANTDAAAISIPIDGPRAVEEAFEKYGVGWVVLIGNTNLLRKSESSFARRRGKWRIGRLELEEVRDTSSLRLIRVTSR